MNNSNISVNDFNNDNVAIVNQNKFLSDNVNDTNIFENNAKNSIDYTSDPSVRENLKKKKNFSISIDGKVLLIITAILFVYILFLPNIYEFFN